MDGWMASGRDVTGVGGGKRGKSFHVMGGRRCERWRKSVSKDQVLSEHEKKKPSNKTKRAAGIKKAHPCACLNATIHAKPIIAVQPSHAITVYTHIIILIPSLSSPLVSDSFIHRYRPQHTATNRKIGLG